MARGGPRNPLTAIKMLVQTNREEAEARGLPAEDLNVIEQEILRMEGRLNVFIDFARPPKPERRRIDLAAIVGDTLALVGGRAARKGWFEVLPPRLRLCRCGRRTGPQLLVDLALNALDVMPRGGILEVELRTPSEHHAELVVLDTGPGIARTCPALQPFFASKETGLRLAWSSPSGSLGTTGAASGDEPAAGRPLLCSPPAYDARAGLGILFGDRHGEHSGDRRRGFHTPRIPPGLQRPRRHPIDGLRRG